VGGAICCKVSFHYGVIDVTPSGARFRGAGHHIAMKTTACLLALLASVGVARADVFVRPSFQYLASAASHFEDKAGAAVAVGTHLGQKGEHEFSAELGYSNWSYIDKPGLPVLGASWWDGSGRLMPLLANYRYVYFPEGYKVGLYAGPSLGLLRMDGDLSVALSGVQYKGSVSEWKCVYGGTVGLVLPLNKTVSVDLGYRYLQSAGISPTLNAGLVSHAWDLGAYKAHVLALGVNIQL